MYFCYIFNWILINYDNKFPAWYTCDYYTPLQYIVNNLHQLPKSNYASIMMVEIPLRAAVMRIKHCSTQLRIWYTTLNSLWAMSSSTSRARRMAACPLLLPPLLSVKTIWILPSLVLDMYMVTSLSAWRFLWRWESEIDGERISRNIEFLHRFLVWICKKDYSWEIYSLLKAKRLLNRALHS